MNEYCKNYYEIYNKKNGEEELKKQTRKNKWLNGEGMCEWCGRHKATINLNLEYGSYRECRYCWDRS